MAHPLYSLFQSTQRLRVSDGAIVPILESETPPQRLLILLWPQLGDFDSLEYAGWLQREAELLAANGVSVRAIGIGDRASGETFCQYTGFPPSQLFVDRTAQLHQQLNLYRGLTWQLPGLSAQQQAWVNLLLMCAGIGSPGTLREVLRGYIGDRSASQLIDNDEIVQVAPLPPLKGSFFRLAGGEGFQRPFELATLRLRNMAEALRHWKTYVPDTRYLTQRGGTFLFDVDGSPIYEYRDRGILGFSATMNRPLSFLSEMELFGRT
jgi:hypothetical protein